MKQYIACEGDTLQKVAQRHLYSFSRWKELADLNRLEDQKLFEGQTIFLPKNTQGTSLSQQKPLPSPSCYVVAYGDTLWKIAEKRLGNANRWGEIAKINRLRHPNYLFLGQPLILPSDARWESDQGTRYVSRPCIPKSEQIRFNQQPATWVPGRGFFHIFQDAQTPQDFSLSQLPQFEVDSKYRGTIYKTEKAVWAGGKALIYSVDTVAEYYKRIKKQHPYIEEKIDFLEKEMEAFKNVGEKGILNISGKLQSALGRSAKFLRGTTLFLTLLDIEESIHESVKERSIKPVLFELSKLGGGKIGSKIGTYIGKKLDAIIAKNLEKEVFEWLLEESVVLEEGMVVMEGVGEGFLLGAAAGIETGPGAIITGIIGGVIGGELAMKGTELVAKHFDANSRKSQPSQPRSTLATTTG